MLRKLIPNVLQPAYWLTLGEQFLLVFQIVRDRRVPLYLKIIPAAAVVYMLWPIDLIPGWIPILGQLDDLAIIMLALRLFVRLAPADVVATYERQIARGDRQAA